MHLAQEAMDDLISKNAVDSMQMDAFNTGAKRALESALGRPDQASARPRTSQGEVSPNLLAWIKKLQTSPPVVDDRDSLLGLIKENMPQK